MIKSHFIRFRQYCVLDPVCCINASWTVDVSAMLLYTDSNHCSDLFLLHKNTNSNMWGKNFHPFYKKWLWPTAQREIVSAALIYFNWPFSLKSTLRDFHRLWVSKWKTCRRTFVIVARVRAAVVSEDGKYWLKSGSSPSSRLSELFVSPPPQKNNNYHSPHTQ